MIRAPQLGDHPGCGLDSDDLVAKREQPLRPAAHPASDIYDWTATGQEVPHLIPGHSVVGAPVRALEVLAVARGKRRIELLARLHVLTSPCRDDGVRSATACRPRTSWAATAGSGCSCSHSPRSPSGTAGRALRDSGQSRSPPRSGGTGR